MNEILFKNVIPSDGNFKLIGFEVEAIFNDYDRYQEVFISTDINSVHNTVLNDVLLNKENCDDNYHIEYTPIYEIINHLYNSFHELSFFQSDENLFKGIFILNAESFHIVIKTPEKNIPSNIDLLNKIKSELDGVININGETNFNKIDKISELLKMF